MTRVIWQIFASLCTTNLCKSVLPCVVTEMPPGTCPAAHKKLQQQKDLNVVSTEMPPCDARPALPTGASERQHASGTSTRTPTQANSEVKSQPEFCLLRSRGCVCIPTCISLGYLARVCVHPHVRLHGPLPCPFHWLFSGTCGDSATWGACA